MRDTNVETFKNEATKVRADASETKEAGKIWGQSMYHQPVRTSDPENDARANILWGESFQCVSIKIVYQMYAKTSQKCERESTPNKTAKESRKSRGSQMRKRHVMRDAIYLIKYTAEAMTRVREYFMPHIERMKGRKRVRAKWAERARAMRSKNHAGTTKQFFSTIIWAILQNARGSLLQRTVAVVSGHASMAMAWEHAYER